MSEIERSDRGICDLIDVCHQTALGIGWSDPADADISLVKASRIALIHSEVSEMFEAIRKPTADKYLPHFSSETVEMADILIRAFDYCAAYKLPILAAIESKIEFNRTRPDHRSEKRPLL